MQPQCLLAPSSSFLSHEAREPPPLPPTHRERCHRKGPGLCTSYQCPQNSLIYAAPQMRLSPQLLLGCVRLTVKTNWHSIFLDNVARSEHDAKGRKDYLVLHTSDFLERVSCQATQTALTSSSMSQLRVTSISQFKDLQEVCLETPWSRLHRFGEKPTVRPALLGQGGGSEHSEGQWL